MSNRRAMSVQCPYECQKKNNVNISVSQLNNKGVSVNTNVKEIMKSILVYKNNQCQCQYITNKQCKLCRCRKQKISMSMSISVSNKTSVKQTNNVIVTINATF